MKLRDSLIILLLIVVLLVIANRGMFKEKRNCKCGYCGKCMCPEGEGESDKCHCSEAMEGGDESSQLVDTNRGLMKTSDLAPIKTHNFKLMRDRGVDTGGAGPAPGESYTEWIRDNELEPDILEKHREYSTLALDRTHTPSRYTVLDDNTDGISTNFTGFSIPRYIPVRPEATVVPSTYNDHTGYANINKPSPLWAIAHQTGRV